MKYTGRVSLTIIIVFAFLFEFGHYFLVEGQLYNPISLVALVPFIYLGWWLGEQYDNLKYISVRDELTNLHNRRQLYYIFPKLKQKADRKGYKLECCLIDVNHFKYLNDTYGHNAGDVVLKNIANTLARIGTRRDVIVRWGGDEFVLLRLIDERKPMSPVGKINEWMNELSMKMKKNISVSIGISIYPDEATDLEELIRLADKDMYSQKQHVKDKVIS